MAKKSNQKVDLKIKTLEEQLQSRNNRIKHLENTRKSKEKKQDRTDLSDNLFLDLFSFLKIG